MLQGFRLAGWLVAFLVLAAFFFVAQSAQATVPTVKTVPWDPTNALLPHTTYPLTATTEVTITMGATVDLHGSADTFSAHWVFGDGSPDVIFAVTNPYNVGTTHQYPFGAAAGTTWTATLTVTDTVTSESNTANYYVIQEANVLASRVNVAIDGGLWYLHTSMWRCDSGAPVGCGAPGGVYGPTGTYGGWDDFNAGSPGCSAFDCEQAYGSGGITASNTQAFEVSGHLESGPASDPYTDDVARALARSFQLLNIQAVASKSYNYVLPSCPTPPCAFTFDGNANGQMIFASRNNANLPFYQGGMFIDEFVAAQTPSQTTHTGVGPSGGLPGINGETYANVVQDMIDGYNYCQDYGDAYSGPDSGGAWEYYCAATTEYNSYPDNSVSQWGAIGEIGAHDVLGIATPTIVTDANQVWLTHSLTASGYFNYNPGALAWGPFATTPSGLVQLTMDNVGRGDTRWDAAESYYHDHFAADPHLGALSAPREYTYGMFSFTKAMLLHRPGGVPSPITLLMDEPAGTNPIDWYNAIGPESGGTDVCDGVAETLVKRQGITGPATNTGNPNPSNPQGGYWTGNNYYFAQNYFETGWSIIMLKKSVFVACVKNLNGRGTPSGRSPARIDLTWTGIPSAASYNVIRGTTSGGENAAVPIGNTVNTFFSDTSGLANGGTYYYELQPVNAAGGVICTSNEVKITISSTGR